MVMIHKNLTPWFWGPKVTSRKPPQPELAVCVRAVFRLAPGQPLEPIEDPMKQGFMSGDTFDAEDIDQRGALRHSSDFAEWKPNAEFLLRGTCFPPDGPTDQCEVKFRVGYWSKSLRVVGPRVFRPGLLMGGKASNPVPFDSMPLTWENAYGGPRYAMNPVGRGHEGDELPTIEVVGEPVGKIGKSGITPASFLPVSPHWPQRSGMRGKKYGADWKRLRAPFYAEDFDWAYFQSAPRDQQINGYLRGDEQLQFVNLSRGFPDWSVTLPALRIRAFVKTSDGVVREPVMNLDTLYADLDDSKLYLTWRGHVPIQQIDMGDVQVVLIAQESLTEPEKPFQEYEDKLTAFADDPVGLAAAMPPGFLEVAKAIQAAELAERNGEPLPDLSALAANLPPGCPFPPWFLAAASGAPDPLGIESKFPPGMLGEDDPLGLRNKIGDLGDESKREPVLEELAAAKEKPADLLVALRKLAVLLPPEQQASMLAGIAELEKGQAAAAAIRGGDTSKVLVEPALTAKPAADEMRDLVAQLQGEVAKATESMAALPTPEAAEAVKRLETASSQLANLPTMDDVVAKALAPLDAMVLPELPPMPDVEAQLAAERAALHAQEAKMRKAGGDNPMLALFTFGHRLIDNAPKAADMVPDFGPIVTGLQQAHDALLKCGVTAVALAPLVRMQQKVQAIQSALPAKTPAPIGEYAGKVLRRRDFSGQDLRGMVFAGSDLTGANFRDAMLDGADFRKADATGADFSGANLTQARMDGCVLEKAKLVGIQGSGLSMAGAEITRADLSDAIMPGADLQQVRGERSSFVRARLVGANLEFADLSKADLRHADLSQSKLTMVVMNLAKADHASLREARADMARFTLCRLVNADLRAMRSSMGSFQGSDLRGADLRACQFEKVDCMQTVLDDANCADADLRHTIFRDTSAIATIFQRANMGNASATGTANFTRADFRGAQAMRSVWMAVDLSGADLRGSCFEFGSFMQARGADVDFAGARLKGACFRQAEFQRARFAQADLCSADFTEARLDDANFRDANCYDMKLLGAKAMRSDFSGAFTAGLQSDDAGEGVR